MKVLSTLVGQSSRGPRSNVHNPRMPPSSPLLRSRDRRSSCRVQQAATSVGPCTSRAVGSTPTCSSTPRASLLVCRYHIKKIYCISPLTGKTRNAKNYLLRLPVAAWVVIRGSGLSRVMVGTCLPVRVCFFAPKAASYLPKACFFTEKYEPVGSCL